MISSVSVIKKEKIGSSRTRTASILFYTKISRVSQIRAITDMDTGEEKKDRCSSYLKLLTMGRTACSKEVAVLNSNLDLDSI